MITMREAPEGDEAIGARERLEIRKRLGVFDRIFAWKIFLVCMSKAASRRVKMVPKKFIERE